MTGNQPPPNEDLTGTRHTGPDIAAPSATVQWRVRTAVRTITELLDQIAEHPDPRPTVQARAEAIRAELERRTSGQKISASAEPWLRDTVAELQRLLRALTGTVHTPADEDRTTAVRPADEWPLSVVIRRENTRLPPVRSRWPWRDRHARRCRRAWARAWWLLQAEPVDRDAVSRAWQRYQSIAAPPAALLNPTTEATTEGT